MALNLSRKPRLLKIVAVVIICCMVVFVSGTTGLRICAPTQRTPGPSACEKQTPVQQTQALYGRKEITKAKQSPAAAALYLGLINPEQSRRAGAIAHWQQHLEIPLISENSHTIPKNHTKMKPGTLGLVDSKNRAPGGKAAQRQTSGHRQSGRYEKQRGADHCLNAGGYRLRGRHHHPEGRMGAETVLRHGKTDRLPNHRDAGQGSIRLNEHHERRLNPIDIV